MHPSSSSTSIFSTSNRAFVTHTLDRSASVDAQFLHHTKNIAAKTPGESWRAFLVYLASLRRLDLAFALLDDLEHHDQATPSVYLSFLSACAQVVHQEADMRAQEIISRMQARGLKPSASHYTALLSAATSPTRITAALQAMTDAGVEPTPVTYIAYFKACSRFAKVHGHGPTLHGYHQFKQRFGTSTLEKRTAMHLFGAVVTSLVQFISPTTEQEVMNVLRDMGKMGLKLNSHFMNSLIYMYLHNDQQEKAYELLNRTKAGTDIEPNEFIYTTFLRYHHDRREYDHCKKLLARMRHDRIPPTHAAMSTFKLLAEQLQDPTIWAAAKELNNATKPRR